MILHPLPDQREPGPEPAGDDVVGVADEQRQVTDPNTVLHTWSGYGAVTDLPFGTDIRLDLTPLGRQDEDVELRHHDTYP